MRLKRRRPGGTAPASVLAAAGDPSDFEVRALCCEMLGLYEPSETARQALLTANLSADTWVRVQAVTSLTVHWPEDAGMRNLLVRALKDRDLGAWHPVIIAQVISKDGSMTDRRRMLYTDEVRRAMLEAMMRAEPVARRWLEARELLREHPCFTEREKAMVP